MRLVLMTAALVATQTTLAFACNPAVLVVREDTLTYEVPSSDIYANGGAARFVDDYVDGRTLLINASNRTTRMVDLDDLSISEVQVLTGTSRVVYRGPSECRPGDPAFVEELYPDGEPANPIPPAEVLFPDGTDTSGPRDGLWRAVVGPTRMEGCPAMIAQAFAGSAGALPGMTGETRRMTFSDPFDPNHLDLSKTLNAGWTQTGPALWTTEAMPDIFGQIPQGAGGGSRLLWSLEVAGPELILFNRTVDLVLPAEAAVLMGASPDGCRVIANNRWERIGD
jgi:hypothetical protein